MESYNKLNAFLKERFGGRVLKICIDGGFTCPNRDGKCGVGGCSFCGERGSGENTKPIDIKSQVSRHLDSYRGDRADKFIAYFQNFTNTYADVATLREKYDSALISDKIVALAIATRPDCVDESVVSLLQEYKDRGLYVWVELGLQTINEAVAKDINLGYTKEQFLRSVDLLASAGIDVVTHIMLGLPGEKESDTKDIVDFVNNTKVSGIKVHSTYVIEGTRLASTYKEGKYLPITLDDYVERVLYILTHIRRDIVVHRITGDAPKDLLIAPDFSRHKKQVLNRIENTMKNDGLYQGIYYKEK